MDILLFVPQTLAFNAIVALSPARRRYQLLRCQSDLQVSTRDATASVAAGSCQFVYSR
jgi:hypothetical protein